MFRQILFFVIFVTLLITRLKEIKNILRFQNIVIVIREKFNRLKIFINAQFIESFATFFKIFTF